jgi:hypothetical protein
MVKKGPNGTTAGLTSQWRSEVLIMRIEEERFTRTLSCQIGGAISISSGTAGQPEFAVGKRA